MTTERFTSKTYVVCWDKSYKNCLSIDRNLNDAGLAYLIHNVSPFDVDSPNWYRADDVRYYGHFRNSMRDFLSTDHDVFIFNAGDVECDSYARYTARIENLFASDPGVGAFAPNMTNDGFSGPGSFIKSSSLHAGMCLATHTNGIYTSLSRDIVATVNEFMDWAESTGRIDWLTMRSGWGLDTVYCALVIYLGRKIYRDESIRLFHQAGTSYDKSPAKREMDSVLLEFKVFCSEKGMDTALVQHIYNVLHDKALTHRSVSIVDVYARDIKGLVA